MTSFTFSVDQVRSAPPEVRRWIEREVTATLGLLNRSEHDPSQVHAATLAACTPQEAAEVYELIKGNFLVSQVFFELAREAPGNRDGAPLHALHLADTLRHTRLAYGDRLVDCFTAINQAFQTVRSDRDNEFIRIRSIRAGLDTSDDTRQHSRTLGPVVPSPATDGQRTGRGCNRTRACRVRTTSPRTERRCR
jgi:hypothetical protein